jgi:hypothetical protein
MKANRQEVGHDGHRGGHDGEADLGRGEIAPLAGLHALLDVPVDVFE